MRFKTSVPAEAAARRAALHGEPSRFRSPERAARQAFRAERFKATDGPFTESKEVLGG